MYTIAFFAETAFPFTVDLYAQGVDLPTALNSTIFWQLSSLLFSGELRINTTFVQTKDSKDVQECASIWLHKHAH